jgi:hypothetical protein
VGTQAKLGYLPSSDVTNGFIVSTLRKNIYSSTTCAYHLVDNYVRQLRLMKLNITNIDENYLSSDIVSIAFAYFLNPLQPSLKYIIEFFLIDTPQMLLQRVKNWSLSVT